MFANLRKMIINMLSTKEEQPITVNVSGQQGTLASQPDSSFSFTPNAGFSGQTSFSYTVGDGFGGTDTGTVTIDVINTAPVADDESYSMRPGETLNIAAPEVLDGDTDADGDTLSVVSVNVTPTNNNKTFNEELEELEERRLMNRKTLSSKVFDEKYEAQERSTGVFQVDDLYLIQNQRARAAVAGLGSWTALANAVRRFTTEMDKTASRRDPAKWESLLEEFHMWNSMSPQPMDADATLATIEKLMIKLEPKSNSATDKIIAEVRNITPEQVREERIARTKATNLKRVHLIDDFNSMLWDAANTNDVPATLPWEKVFIKLAQTMEWIASWDSYDPAAVAGEIMEIKEDVRLLRKQEKLSNTAGKKLDFDDGQLTADGMIRNSMPAIENNRGFTGVGSRNIDVVKDKQAYEEWLASDEGTDKYE